MPANRKGGMSWALKWQLNLSVLGRKFAFPCICWRRRGIVKKEKENYRSLAIAVRIKQRKKIHNGHCVILFLFLMLTRFISFLSSQSLALRQRHCISKFMFKGQQSLLFHTEALAAVEARLLCSVYFNFFFCLLRKKERMVWPWIQLLTPRWLSCARRFGTARFKSDKILKKVTSKWYVLIELQFEWRFQVLHKSLYSVTSSSLALLCCWVLLVERSPWLPQKIYYN